MKKTCEHIEPELSAYIFDELDPPARTEVEQHLAACENCRKELTDLRATLGALEEKFHATPVAAELSAERVNAIRENATSESLTEKRSANVVSIGVKRHPILWTLGMAAAAMLLVVPVINQGMSGKSHPKASVEAQSAKADFEVASAPVPLGEKKRTQERPDYRTLKDGDESGVATTSSKLVGTEQQIQLGKLDTIYHGDTEITADGPRAASDTSKAERIALRNPEPSKEGETQIAMAEAKESRANSSGYEINATGTDPISETGHPGHARSEIGQPISELDAEEPERPRPTQPNWTVEVVRGEKRRVPPNDKKDESGNRGSGRELAEQGKAEAERQIAMLPPGDMPLDPPIVGRSISSASASGDSRLNQLGYVDSSAPAPRAAEMAPQGAAMSAREASGQLGRSYEIADAPQEQLRRYERPQTPPATDNRFDRFYYQPSPPQDMTFQDYGVNPFVQTQADPLSTFSMDVDTGSFTVARNYLNRNTAPPPAAIRVEEILNYFPAPYPAPKESDFAVYGEMAPSPFGQNLHLLKIGIKGREMTAERKPVVLTFVIDVSGSMDQENRLGLVQRTLNYLTGFMRPEDQIGIAVFSSNGREVLTHTPVSDRSTIMNAVNSLRAEQSTNVGDGLLIGYGMARRAYNAKAINRIVLCSDGVANAGVTNVPGILDLAAQGANEKIYLTSLGVGMGNYNDTLMEQLADKGNGHYAYLDADQEAQRYVSRELVSAMEVIAQDTKIQVEFNAAVVKQYRLIGFENRNVADADFRNDKVDAGEIGTGHAVTALYEVELAQGAEDEDRARESAKTGFKLGPLIAAVVHVRYKQPDKEMKAKEIAGKLKLREIMKRFEASEPHMKLVAIAAEYAEILRNSYWSRGSDMGQVAALFDRTFPGNPPGPEAGELRGLIDIASRVAWNRPAPVPPIGVIPNEPRPEPFPGEPGNAIPMEELGTVTP